MLDPAPTLAQELEDAYRIERELGTGGMATVYLAHDLANDRPVALKVLDEDRAAEVGAERFSREIALAARLSHKHICPILDSGRTPSGYLWYTMPYVTGESLREWLRRDGPLPVGEAVRIAREAALGLGHAHKHGILHRDIKPENLLITGDGTTLVADFGIAKGMDGHTDSHGLPTLTMSDQPVGTPLYMSPEQRLGAALDARSDVFSLGATLFELLTNRFANSGGMGLDLFLQQMTDAMPRVRLSRPEVSPEIEKAVRKAIHFDPRRRFQTMEEFAAALSPHTAEPSRSRRGPWIGLAIVAAAIVAAIVLLR